VLTPQIQVRVDHAAASAYGLAPGQLLAELQQLVDGERIDETGLWVGGVHYDLDCIIFASGFEVGTPAARRSGFESGTACARSRPRGLC
jgi:hypothetical protein